MRVAVGTLLVASPRLGDPHFLRSVLYVLEHGPAGSLAFIINRPLDTPLEKLWADAPPGLRQARIAAEGGPVERGKGLLLHGDGGIPGAQPMAEGLWIGGSIDALVRRWPQGADHAGPRLFLGHSGWAADQLDGEIADGAWTVRPGRPDLLLEAPPGDTLWERLTRSRCAPLAPHPN